MQILRRLLHNNPNIVIATLLVVVILLAYSPVFTAGFVNYDDDLYVKNDPVVKDGLKTDGIIQCFTKPYEANWIPLTRLTYMVEHQLFGENSFIYHLNNLILHIANTLLLYFLLIKLTGARRRSAFVAGLFALHPLHVESVAWIAERKDVLSTLFWLLTIWMYSKWAAGKSWRTYGSVIIFFLIGLLAKPMLVTLPLTLLLLDYWPLRRWHCLASEPGKNSAASRLIVEKIPLFALSAIGAVITFFAQRSDEAVASVEQFPLGIRLANAFVSYIAYIIKTILPVKLAVFYPYSIPPMWQVLGSILIISAITIGVWQIRKTAPYILFGWAWYLITLLPVIGLIQVGAQAMADRYTYVPLIGIFIAAVWGIRDLLNSIYLKTSKNWQRFALPIAIALLAVLAICTNVQARYWKDGFTLFEHTRLVTKNNALAEFNAGNAVRDKGDIETAIEYYKRAIKIDPNRIDAQNNLASAYFSLGMNEKAVEHYAIALRINPNDAAAQANMGTALASLGRFEEATSHLLQSLALNNKNPAAHNTLGVIYAQLGRIDDAIDQFNKAIALDPGKPEYLRNLVQAQMLKKNPPKQKK
jgi:tetratricopeptide (TPR) repeat protein